MAINGVILKRRRKELGLTQHQLVAKVREICGGLSQSGYVRIEQGDLDRSVYLVHICEVLGIKVSDVDDRVTDPIDNDTELLFNQLQGLPENERIEIVQRLLESFKR